MRKPDMARLREAAKARAARGPWQTPADRKAAEEQVEKHVRDIIAALEAGRPLPEDLYRRAAEPLTPEEEVERAQAAQILDERRRQIEEARQSLAEAREEE